MLWKSKKDKEIEYLNKALVNAITHQKTYYGYYQSSLLREQKASKEVRVLNRSVANKAKLKKALKHQTQVNKELLDRISALEAARVEDLKVIRELSVATRLENFIPQQLELPLNDRAS